MSCGWVETPAGWARMQYVAGAIRSFGFIKKKPFSVMRDSFPEIFVQAIESHRAGAGAFSLLDMAGTLYQRKVWEILAKVPCGETMTYKELAELVAGPSHARAVARACSRNRMAVLIPCHRVVGQGTIGGYRWGQDKKSFLLEWEKEGRGGRDFFRSFWRGPEG